MSKNNSLSKVSQIYKEKYRSEQMELWSAFSGNANLDEMSNSMDIWDSIPKYFLSGKKQAELRRENKATSYVRNFTIFGVDYEVTLYPATINQPDGTDINVFPGVTEEIIEEALKKLATQKFNGFNHLDGSMIETWVLFSYRELQSILIGMGHKVSIPNIKRSLEILRLSQIKIKPISADERGVIRKDFINYLPDASLIDREAYESSAEAKNAIKLPLLVTQAVLNGEYRQINNKLYGQLRQGLSRWLYRRFNRTWLNACVAHPLKPNRRGTCYDIALNELANSSGYLEHKDIKYRRTKLIRALDDLQSKDIINRYEQYTVIENDDGQPVDYVFRVYASKRFTQEQINANERAKNNRVKAEKLTSKYVAS
jgi:hypothetical protein